MADRAASLLAKIRNKSKEKGWNSMQSLQLFCQEEFICRINLSRYKDAFILKGGLLICSVKLRQQNNARRRLSSREHLQFPRKNARNHLRNH